MTSTLEGKTVGWEHIFTAADMADAKTKALADKLKKYFTKSGNGKGTGIDIDDVQIVRINNGTRIKLDLDTDGADKNWSKQLVFPYEKVFNAQGQYDQALFGQAIREKISAIFKNSTFISESI